MPAYKKKIKAPGQSADVLFKLVSGGLEGFLKKMGISDFEIKTNASKKQIELESKFFSATLIARKDELELDGSLSLLAMPFKSKIDEGIEKWIQKNLKA